MAVRTRLSPEERRRQLVALGVNALADRPLDEITIEWLAQQASVSRGLVFYYFGSKTGMHHEIVSAARDSMLHATEPRPELPPLERLRDTLERIVRFARDHRATFYSLVRGTAAGDADVREVVEAVRTEQTQRVTAVFLELGVPDTALVRVALASWVALAEHTLVDGALGGALPADELVGYLERSAAAVVDAALAEGSGGGSATAGRIVSTR